MTDLSTSLIARLDRHGPADEEAWLPSMKNRPRLRSLPYSASGLMSSYEPTPSGRAASAVLPSCLVPFLDELAPRSQETSGKHVLAALLPHGVERQRWEKGLRDLEKRYPTLLRLVLLDDARWPAERSATLAFSRPALALVRP